MWIEDLGEKSTIDASVHWTFARRRQLQPQVDVVVRLLVDSDLLDPPAQFIHSFIHTSIRRP